MLERLVGHHRPQVGAADSNIDYVANSLPCVSLPLAAPDTVAEDSHSVENGMDLWHYILAIDNDGAPFGRAQGYVQYGSPFRDIDFVPAKHGVDSGLEAGLPRQIHQQLDGFAGNAILRVVEEQAHSLNRQLLTALWISREEIAQMQSADLLVVGFERLPGLQSSQRFDSLILGDFGYRCRHFEFPLNVCLSEELVITAGAKFDHCHFIADPKARVTRRILATNTTIEEGRRRRTRI
jgi:hypothetical protein